MSFGGFGWAVNYSRHNTLARRGEKWPLPKEEDILQLRDRSGEVFDLGEQVCWGIMDLVD